MTTRPEITSAALIAVAGVGGTIAMESSAAGQGATPALGAGSLVAAVPGLTDPVPSVPQGVRLTTTEIANVASPSVTLGHVRDVYAWAHAQVEGGAAGVVVTHGTDTLEESAFLLDLFWDRPEPLVVTGAMRAASAAGADGPANLLAAVRTAASADARGQGVLVVLDDEVHLASRATKTDSMAVSTFGSPGFGPLGHVVEGEYRPAWAQLERPEPLDASVLATLEESVRVPLVEAGLAEDGDTIARLADSGVRALVIAGGGVGHVSAAAAEVVGRVVADGVLVVMAARTASGGTARALYGYPGAEVDLRRRGVVQAGRLSARKARLLLHVLTSSGADRDEVAARFARWGRSVD